MFLRIHRARGLLTRGTPALPWAYAIARNVLIDHSRAFPTAHVLHDPEDVLRCDRGLFARLRQLDAATLQSKLSTWLTADQLSAILIRRDLLVKAFEARIAEKGETQVLYDHLPAR